MSIEYQRIYRERNKEKIKKNAKIFRLENQLKVKEWAKNWKLRNREKVKESTKKWRLENKDKIREYRKQYKISHKEQNRFSKRENYYRNKKLLGRPKRGSWYEKTLKLLKERDGNCCKRCKTTEKLTINHLILQCVSENKREKDLKKLEILCHNCNIKHYHEILKKALIHYYKCELSPEKLSVTLS